tara:strand:- start:311 stop:961 length:651 start_codon:yes stop_codon:yes gene_type:complete
MNYNIDNNTLKHFFDGQAEITENYSQAFQDLFVLSMLNGKKEGRYVEIGAWKPKTFNNTFLLEDVFRWDGFSVEIDNNLCESFNSNEDRKNICYQGDATEFDYLGVIEKRKWDNRIDYLSVDCEPPTNTFKALKKFPLDKYKCSVITFEHDLYAFGYDILNESRIYLKEKGYQIVCSNVCNNSYPFEDWWIDPEVVDEKIWKPFECSITEASNIFI